MKRLLLTLAVLLGAGGAALYGQGAPTRILPLGDSITEGHTGYVSYRYWLWHDLLTAGFGVDFVGSMVGVYNGPPLYDDFDQDHEGHWGWRADEILANIAFWADQAQPDIVLIHLGHNDLWQGQGIPSTLDELESIIQELRLVNPAVKILLAQVIPAVSGIGLDEIPAFNAEIPALAASLDTPESPVIVVDQWTGFDPVLETWDGVHPNEPGEIKMADRWLPPLLACLEPPATPRFLRGDCNANGGVQIDDAVFMLEAVFAGEPVSCGDACDANDDELLDIADPIYLLAYLFDSGASPPGPFGACGEDPGGAALSCDAFPPCP